MSKVKKTAPNPPLKAGTYPPNLYAAEIRKHYYLDRYVVIAPKRHLRPDSFKLATAKHKTETAKSPALENEFGLAEIKNSQGQWQVKVIPNAFPALSLGNPQAYGQQEIVIETPEHNVEFSELPIPQIERIFDIFIERIKALAKVKGIRYVSVFKNDGPLAGASIAHAHSQIVALPMIPTGISVETNGYEVYKMQYGRCPVCDLRDWEHLQKIRLVDEDRHFSVIAPYGSTAPYGVWLIPRACVANFISLSKAQRHSLAAMLKNIAAKLDSVPISFNYFLQDSVPGYDQHFMLKVEPRTNIWAGLELATGLIVNPIPPEYAARWYRGEEK